MADGKKEPWLNYLALSTVILALCATLSTFKGGSYSTRSVLSQSQAANQWAYYQAKSLKGYLYEIRKEEIEMDLKERESTLTPDVIREIKAKLDSYAKRIARYDAEKEEISKEAKKFEEIREDAQKHSQTFGIAMIFLQIAILLSSIAALLGKKLLWCLGMVVGATGVVYFANGFFLFLG